MAVPQQASPLSLCFVFAHPDDESFGVAGTVARYAAAGVRSNLICATRGEAGLSNGLADAGPALGELRTNEMACAARVMGLGGMALLDFPDGEGAAWERAELAAQVAAALRHFAPTAVVTFDPDGITRHPDHVVVHEVTRQCVLDAGPALGIRRLYYQVVTCPSEASPEGPSLACVSREAVDVSVDIRGFEPAKRAALACHRSQAADTAHLLDQPEGSLACEHYVLAWAADGWRPRLGEDDLLAGL